MSNYLTINTGQEVHKMKSFLISYDLIKDKDYKSVHEKIKSYPNWAKPLESLWIIKSDNSATEIRDNVGSVMDSDDKLIVLELTGVAAWKNLSAELSGWIKDNL